MTRLLWGCTAAEIEFQDCGNPICWHCLFIPELFMQLACCFNLQPRTHKKWHNYPTQIRISIIPLSSPYINNWALQVHLKGLWGCYYQNNERICVSGLPVASQINAFIYFNLIILEMQYDLKLLCNLMRKSRHLQWVNTAGITVAGREEVISWWMLPASALVIWPICLTDRRTSSRR